jgi:superfamily II DNA or RNA helicase
MGIEIYVFPEAAKKSIITKVIPQRYTEIEGNYIFVNQQKIDGKSFLSNLWYFQENAINNWKVNGYNGIFSMATGTGKTKTAIGGIIDLRLSLKDIFVIIACPQNTIIKQWEAEINNLDLFKHSVIADGTNSKWKKELANYVLDYSDGHIDSCVAYTTYQTLSSDKFISIIKSINKPVLLVCDEVHWAGAATFSKGLLPMYQYRLGLSATPERYMDDVGTDLIHTYFGKVVYEFTLEQALSEKNPVTRETFLCPYNYYPIFIPLNADELLEYNELDERIKRQYAKEAKNEQKSDFLQRLYEKRQAIIVNAQGKFSALDELVSNMKDIKYLFIYVSPQQIDEVQSILNECKLVNHRFTGREGTKSEKKYKNQSERDFILSNFENGNYRALVAMKCLDEGINVLRAETGIFMASSGNPKQFIQRRGRLLRRHADKKIAEIYDLFVVPFLNYAKTETVGDMEKKILVKELKRYEEFAALADNRLEAMNSIFKIKEKYNIY